MANLTSRALWAKNSRNTPKDDSRVWHHKTPIECEVSQFFDLPAQDLTIFGKVSLPEIRRETRKASPSNEFNGCVPPLIVRPDRASHNRPGGSAEHCECDRAVRSREVCHHSLSNRAAADVRRTENEKLSPDRYTREAPVKSLDKRRRCPTNRAKQCF
jgi:hypothetical protein